jgi:hypothetical protein
MTLRRSIRRLLSVAPVSLTGPLEYYLRPGVRRSWGGPLNNQKARRRIVLELLTRVEFTAIIETGAFRGTTTEFFAIASQLPVYTVEVIRQSYAYARWRLRRLDVDIRHGDSRRFLRDLAADPSVPKQHALFYLDAHWQDDLPLAEEVRIILDHWVDSVIMIDDFKVPGDPGYGFADYGPDACLHLPYLEPLTRFAGIAFPACSSEDETGSKQGSALLATPGPGPVDLAGLSHVRVVEQSAAAQDLGLAVSIGSAGQVSGSRTGI